MWNWPFPGRESSSRLPILIHYDLRSTLPGSSIRAYWTMPIKNDLHAKPTGHGHCGTGVLNCVCRNLACLGLSLVWASTRHTSHRPSAGERHSFVGPWVARVHIWRSRLGEHTVPKNDPKCPKVRSPGLSTTQWFQVPIPTSVYKTSPLRPARPLRAALFAALPWMCCAMDQWSHKKYIGS